jgi:hypothetical protein
MKLEPMKSPWVRFLAKFVCWYVALFMVLAQMEGFYGGFFRTVGELIYGKKDRVSEVSFEPLVRGDDSSHTRVVIVNKALMKQDGSGPVRNLDIGTRGYGSGSLALLISLILASPLPWSRRSKSLLLGIFWQQVSLLLFLGYCIWFDSAEVGLVTFSSNGKDFAAAIKNALAGGQLVAFPIFVWLTVTFRAGDLSSQLGMEFRNDLDI